jgi:ABC-2 type transport system permease protein
MTVSAAIGRRPVTGRIGASLRKYGAVFRLSLLAQLAYPAEIWLRLLFVFIIMFVFSSLWHTAYAEMGRSTLGGLNLSQMLWYLAITESIILSRPRDAMRIDDEVRTGQLAYQFARPYNYLLYRFAQMWGERLPRFLITAVVAVTLATVFSRAAGASMAGLMLGVPALLLALAIDFMLVTAISFLAFWVEDTAPFLFIYDRFLMILGGMLLPLELFPGLLETVARLLPFSAIVYAPARVFVDPHGADLIRLLMHQMLALIGASIVAILLLRYAERRLQSNGG